MARTRAGNFEIRLEIGDLHGNDPSAVQYDFEEDEVTLTR